LLSERGRAEARELGVRRHDDGLDAVFSSDLRRAVETAELAFDGTTIPRLLDWRLRECDYGDLNGSLASLVHDRRHDYLHTPYPNGESWEQALARVDTFLRDLPMYWDGARVLVIGHIATRWALEHHLRDRPLLDLDREVFVWQPGWEYEIRG
jgi:2,3-bisphosphoglycerate-dependent phosphoglycerate mutase